MVNVLRGVKAKGFRSLNEVDVDFGPFSVLVGPNGSGKSNLLRVLSFVRDTARFDTSQAIGLAGGFEHLLRQDGSAHKVSLTIEAVVSEFANANALDRYTLELQEETGGISRQEELLYKRVKGRGRRLAMKAEGSEVVITSGKSNAQAPEQRLRLASSDVSALGAMARIDEDELGPGPRDFFSFLSNIRYLDPNVEDARIPSRLARATLSDDASNLSAALLTLSQDSPDGFSALKRDLARCLPGLDDIGFAPVGGSATSVVVQLHERGLLNPVELADASFGTVRLLALLVALHEPEPPKLTIIEEVDHGLHPYALDVLVDRMRDASSRTQVIVASHSPTLVNRLQADEIIICDRDPETGESIIPATDADDLAEVLERSDWKAGELWFSGALGGVPQ